jgi:hypothetical protein
MLLGIKSPYLSKGSFVVAKLLRSPTKGVLAEIHRNVIIINSM